MNRRTFLKTAGLLAAGPLIVTHRLRGADAPSNRINVGQVGLGWIGGTHLNAILGRKDARYVAVCDVNGARARSVQERINRQYADNSCKAFRDYREMLAMPGLDAVIVATPDHWHAQITIAAAIAGKDVYCEKPLSLTIAEGREMVNTVTRYGCVFQTGSQQRSSSFGPFRFACEHVRNERIGKIVSVDVSTGNPPVPCDLPEEKKLDDFDWEMWVGQTPWRPYHSKLADKMWRPYSEYCGGGFADMGAHHFDIAQWGLGMDRSGPVEILAPDPSAKRERISFRYANGVIVNHVGGNCLGLTFRGTEGTLYVGRDGFWTKPAHLAREPLSPADIRLYNSGNHHSNWLDCIRTRQPCVADIETGHRSATVCHLGNIAYELGRSLKWDPLKEQFVGDDHANRLLTRARRSPWTS